MQVPFVDLRAQYAQLKAQIDTAIHEVIDECAFVGGRRVSEFERAFAEISGAKHCVAVANGTDAIYISLKMLGIGVGDEVITTASSWISTSETITQTGAVPVFVDVDKYFNIDVTAIRSKINDRTKAILPVHLYGQAAQMVEIAKICSDTGLLLLEDCAQAHLSTFDGQPVGTFGAAGTFSFYPGKNLGAYGDAGAIITNDDELADKLRMFANHGSLKKHEHYLEGMNSRLDGIQAAVLLAKLPWLQEWTAKRQQNARRYDELLKEIPALTVPQIRQGSGHVYHLYVIRIGKRDGLREYLSSNGIQTGIHYPRALPALPPYARTGFEREYPNAIRYQHEILSLPMFPELTHEAIDYVVTCIAEYCGVDTGNTYVIA